MAHSKLETTARSFKTAIEQFDPLLSLCRELAIERRGKRKDEEWKPTLEAVRNKHPNSGDFKKETYLDVANTIQEKLFHILDDNQQAGLLSDYAKRTTEGGKPLELHPLHGGKKKLYRPSVSIGATRGEQSLRKEIRKDLAGSMDIFVKPDDTQSLRVYIEEFTKKIQSLQKELVDEMKSSLVVDPERITPEETTAILVGANLHDHQIEIISKLFFVFAGFFPFATKQERKKFIKSLGLEYDFGYEVGKQYEMKNEEKTTVNWMCGKLEKMVEYCILKTLESTRIDLERREVSEEDQDPKKQFIIQIMDDHGAGKMLEMIQVFCDEYSHHEFIAAWHDGKDDINIAQNTYIPEIQKQKSELEKKKLLLLKIKGKAFAASLISKELDLEEATFEIIHDLGFCNEVIFGDQRFRLLGNPVLPEDIESLTLETLPFYFITGGDLPSIFSMIPGAGKGCGSWYCPYCKQLKSYFCSPAGREVGGHPEISQKGQENESNKSLEIEDLQDEEEGQEHSQDLKRRKPTKLDQCSMLNEYGIHTRDTIPNVLHLKLGLFKDLMQEVFHLFNLHVWKESNTLDTMKKARDTIRSKIDTLTKEIDEAARATAEEEEGETAVAQGKQSKKRKAKEISSNQVIATIARPMKYLEEERKKLEENLEKENKRIEIKEADNTRYKRGKGQIEKILRQIGVRRQGQFGGSYIGPHITKVMNNREEVFQKIEGLLTLNSSSDSNVRPDANIDYVKRKLLELKEMIRVLDTCCSVMLGSHRPLTEAQIKLFEAAAIKFDQLYWSYFKKRTPKLHILVSHVPSFLRRFRSLGEFSEQSLERAHYSIKKVSKGFEAVKNYKQRTLGILNRWYLSRHPKIRTILQQADEQRRRNISENSDGFIDEAIMEEEDHDQTEESNQEEEFGFEDAGVLLPSPYLSIIEIALDDEMVNKEHDDKE